MRNALTDSKWETIQPILPNKSRGMPRVDDRRVLNGIFWVLRSGAPWRDLPQCFGPYTTCYNRFNRWGKAGIWDGILNVVTNVRKADVQMLDTTIVWVHQHGACAKRTLATNVGRSRGGLTTKIHAVVDGKGLPIRLALSAGQQHDSIAATDLLIDWHRIACFWRIDPMTAMPYESSSECEAHGRTSRRSETASSRSASTYLTSARSAAGAYRQTQESRHRMSVIPPITEVAIRGDDVRYVPIVLQKSLPGPAMIYAVHTVLKLSVAFGRARLCRGSLTAFAQALSRIGLAGWS